ncbi:MAG TPA: dienelactone hydrolase family protein [Hyphomicrobiaceae bacterium]|nr:dienelactone hydrolase family protein [Hyphomicrobiaceae bacterium]
MQVSLTAPDGHNLLAHFAEPQGPVRGGLVVIQEIFGVNHHIRGVTDGFAKDGYAAISPALFDRVGSDIQLGYEADDIAKGRDYRGQIDNSDALKDVAAAVAFLAGKGLKVGVVGYCWGGSLSWAAATRLSGISAAVCYYGGELPALADEAAKCPAIAHFGETDASIPMDKVAVFQAKQAAIPTYIYKAGHGFSCDERGSFDKASHELARERTIAFFREHIG